MDNKEAVLDALEEYNKKPTDEVPTLLEEYLRSVARTGETWFPWCKMKQLVVNKMDHVMREFQQHIPMGEIITGSNMNTSKFEDMRKYLLQLLSQFNGIPFTIQRICELVTNPKKHYKQTDKFMRGVEKNVMVVTTVDPFGNKVVHESKVMVNGMDANGYSGGEMVRSPYVPYIPPTNTPTSSPVSSWFNSPMSPAGRDTDGPAAKVARKNDFNKDSAAVECDSSMPQAQPQSAPTSEQESGLQAVPQSATEVSRPDNAEDNSNSSCSSSDSSSSDTSASGDAEIPEDKTASVKPPPPSEESSVAPLKDLAQAASSVKQTEEAFALSTSMVTDKDTFEDRIHELDEDGGDRRDSRDSQGFEPEDTDPEIDQPPVEPIVTKPADSSAEVSPETSSTSEKQIKDDKEPQSTTSEAEASVTSSSSVEVKTDTDSASSTEKPDSSSSNDTEMVVNSEPVQSDNNTSSDKEEEEQSAVECETQDSSVSQSVDDESQSEDKTASEESPADMKPQDKDASSADAEAEAEKPVVMCTEETQDEPMDVDN